MAAFCEIKDVLDLISYKTEIYYDAQKDSVGDSLYSGTSAPRRRCSAL